MAGMNKAIFPRTRSSVHNRGESNVASVENVVVRLGNFGVKLRRGTDKSMTFAVGDGVALGIASELGL